MTIVDLIIEQTEETPKIRLSASEKSFSISGRSLPENAYAFYRPIIEWVREYCSQHPEKTVFDISMDYFNSSSSRFLFELLTIIEENEKAKKAFEIRWYTSADDELMVEKGEELKGLLDLNFMVLTR